MRNEKRKCGIRELGNVRVKRERESTVTKDPCRDDLREDNGSDRLHRTHVLKLRVFLSFSPPNMGVYSHIESRCSTDSDFNAGAITQLSEYPHA